MAKNKTKKKRSNPALSPKEQTLIRMARQVTKCTMNGTEPALAYPKPLVEEINDIMHGMHTKMTREFYETSVSKGIHGEPKDEVLKGNVIELPDMDTLYDMVDQDLSEKARAWNNRMQLLHAIPCFRTGVLKKQGQADNETEYIQWTVNDVDVQNLYMNVTLQVYTDIDAVDGKTIWAPGPKITTGLDYSDEDGLSTKIDPEGSVAMTEASTCVPYSLLKWTPFQIELWKNTSLYIVKQQEENWEKDHDLDIYNYTIRDFIVNMCLVNDLLERERPRAARSATTKKAEATFELDQDRQDERKVRTISMVKFTSKSVPRMPTEKSVIKYNVASWNTRGHLRHYKSGKTVYVRPSVHHRKALLKDELVPSPTTIRFTEGEKHGMAEDRPG